MSIMGLKGLKNNVSRDGFSLQSKRNFTAKAGELLPVWWRYTYLGDKFNIHPVTVTRTAPLNTAASARMTEYWDFYYVPLQQLWNKSNDVLNQLNYEQNHATGLGNSLVPYNGELPYLTTEQVGTYIRNIANSAVTTDSKNFFGYDRAPLSCKLLEYLQLGNYELYCAKEITQKLPYNLDFCVFPLAAYQKIYADHFRNQQWEQVNPSSFNFDYMTGSEAMNIDLPDGGSPFYHYGNMFDLRYCNWQMDLYHGLLPSAQYGDTAVVPFSNSDLSVTVKSLAGSAGYTNQKIPVVLSNGGVDQGLTVGPNSVNAGDYLTVQAGAQASSGLVSTLDVTSLGASGTYAVNGSTAGLSILALRQYEFMQKWKEIAQAGDQNYKAFAERIWGVSVPDVLSGKSRWIGGFDNTISINEVVNQNITGEYGADIAGKGYGSMSRSLSFTNNEGPGVLMCIYHCAPNVDYTCDYISPEALMVNAEDFPNPVFDRIGMESVSTASLLNDTSAAIADGDDYKTPFMLGYAPRFINAKTDIDISVGAFKRDLKSWVVSYGYEDIIDSLKFVGGSNPGVPAPSSSVPQTGEGNNYAFMKINPNVLDPIMAKAADSDVNSDQLWVFSFFDVSAVRNFDRDGLPY